MGSKKSTTAKKNWKADPKKRMQVTLICGAYIEVKAAAKDKRGNVSKTVETTELDANDVASEEGLAQKILAAYKRRISQVTEIPVSAEGYTLQDVHEDLMLISGSVTSKAQKFYDGGSVWRRAKKLYKTLRNDIHASYCEVKQEGLLTLSGQNTVEDNKAAILQRYWRNIGSKTHVDLEQGEEEEEEEVEPAPGVIPESAATAATGTDETAMQEVERAVQAANENSQEAATPVQPAPTRNNTPPSACLAVEHPMPPAYKGPLEWEAWLTYGSVKMKVLQSITAIRNNTTSPIPQPAIAVAISSINAHANTTSGSGRGARAG